MSSADCHLYLCFGFCTDEMFIRHCFHLSFLATLVGLEPTSRHVRSVVPYPLSYRVMVLEALLGIEPRPPSFEGMCLDPFGYSAKVGGVGWI